MRYRLLITVVFDLMLLAAHPIHAQTPPAWPPDPAVIFAEDVEVIDAKEIIALPPEARQTRCGRLESRTDSDVALIKQGEQFHICELATGALSQPMPIENSWNYGTLDGRILATSPDQKWAWYISHQAHVVFHLRAYERATGRLVDLGVIPDTGKYFQEFGWASDMELYYTSRDMPEWYPTDAFVATIPIENSLKNVMSNTRFPVFYHDDPPRFEKWEVPSNDQRYIGGMPPVDCTRSVYDFSAQQTTVYHYGNLCIPEYGDAEGDGYYRDVQDDGTGWLVRFNPITLERKNLYHGRLLHVLWVSNDDAYALITVDDKGAAECRPGFEFLAPMYYCSPVNPKLVLVELGTARILYQLPITESAISDFDLPVVYHHPEVSPYVTFLVAIDQRTLALRINEQGERTLATSILMRIDGQTVTTEALDGVTDAYLDSRHLILRTISKGTKWAAWQHVILDLASHAKTVITNAVEGYEYIFERVDENIAAISVSPTYGYAYPLPSMQYTIKLPSY